jgi:hypothetical protein
LLLQQDVIHVIKIHLHPFLILMNSLKNQGRRESRTRFQIKLIYFERLFEVRKKGKFDFGVVASCCCSFSMIGLKDRKHEFVLRSPISPSLGDVAGLGEVGRDGLPCEFATVQDFDGCHFSKIRKLVKLCVFDV